TAFEQLVFAPLQCRIAVVEDTGFGIELCPEFTFEVAPQRRSPRDGAKQKHVYHRPQFRSNLVEKPGGTLVYTEHMIQIRKHKGGLVEDREHAPNHHLASREEEISLELEHADSRSGVLQLARLFGGADPGGVDL